MAFFQQLENKGLDTFNNPLKLPAGTLLLAYNVVINSSNVIEPRRGFKLYGDAASGAVKQLFNYKDRFLRHIAPSTIQWDDGVGAFTSFSGSYIEPVLTSTAAGQRMRGIEANGNYYLTTTTGIRKISAANASAMGSASLSNAGIPQALNISAELDTSQIGFLEQDSSVAYRLIWGIKDQNTNTILGSPSERVILDNPIESLLASDFTGLLANLDGVSNSGGINDGNYVTTLKPYTTLAPVPSAETMRSKIVALAVKLDADTVITGAVGVSTTEVLTATTIQLIFASSVATYLAAGDTITLSGYTSAAAPNFTQLNGKSFTVTSVSTTTVNATITTGTLVTPQAATNDGSNEVVTRKKYSLSSFGTYSTLAAADYSSPTSTQMEDLQTFYDLIVTTLQNEPAGIITDNSPFDNNESTQSTVANITVSIPDNITTSHFYQLYRTPLKGSLATNLTIADSDPGEEMKLSVEGNPTAGEITAGLLVINDVTPEAILATAAGAYFNPNSGEGILQSNDTPPLARDLALYKNYLFYGNTKTQYTKDITLLSADSLVNGVSTFTITDGSTTNTYTFVTPGASFNVVDTVADTANSLNGKYFLLYSGEDETAYYVYYKTSGGALYDPAISGKTGIKVSITTGDTADTVASLTQLKLNQYTDFIVSNTAITPVQIRNAKKGISTNCSAGTSGTKSATTSNGSPILFSVTTPSDVKIGARVTGTGIPANTYISAVGSTSLTMSNNATATNTGVTVSYTSDPGFTINAGPGTGSGVGEDATNKKVILSAEATPSQRIDETARSLVRVINQQSGEIVNAFYVSGADDLPGQIHLREINWGTTGFYLNVDAVASTGDSFSPSLPISGSTVIADNESSPNRLYYSKVQQPEAVPVLNYIDVGPKDKAIKRILALRNGLFILKEEGIYRLSGEVANAFTVSLDDNSALIRAPDSAVVLNNMIYMYTDQGVVRISDTNTEVISRSIEDQLLVLTTTPYTYFAPSTFGVSYESDRSYYLWTIEATTDTHATRCFRFNTFTNSWTVNTRGARCGLVNFSDNKLYTGAETDLYMEQERKALDRTDYADRELAVTISAVSTTAVTVSSATGIDIGDVLVQTQYLTITQYNAMLTKLDADSGVTDVNYSSLHAAVAGSNLRTKLTSVATKLDADAGVNSTNYASSISAYTTSFADTQSAFNVIINKLNLDSGVTDINYASSLGTTEVEAIVEGVNASVLTMNYAASWIAGTVTAYDLIECEVLWAPIHTGSPLLSKHFRDSTIMFEDQSFTHATIGFSTDLNPTFEEFDFDGEGVAATNGAAIPSNVPFRTLVPRNMARCRYLNIKFKHAVAREGFKIDGISASYENMSERSYR